MRDSESTRVLTVEQAAKFAAFTYPALPALEPTRTPTITRTLPAGPKVPETPEMAMVRMLAAYGVASEWAMSDPTPSDVQWADLIGAIDLLG